MAFIKSGKTARTLYDANDIITEDKVANGLIDNDDHQLDCNFYSRVLLPSPDRRSLQLAVPSPPPDVRLACQPPSLSGLSCNGSKQGAVFFEFFQPERFIFFLFLSTIYMYV